MIKRYDVVEILPDWRDDGDEKYVWAAVADEYQSASGHSLVTISPINSSLTYPPVYTVRTEWVVKHPWWTTREDGE